MQKELSWPHLSSLGRHTCVTRCVNCQQLTLNCQVGCRTLSDSQLSTLATRMAPVWEGDTVTTLSSVTRTTLREQVLERLREGILSGAFPPGERLGEVDLADQLGVSRGTVREALRTLQQTGLVEGKERNSLHVRRLTAREIAELFEVRAALEGQALVSILEADDPGSLIEELQSLLPTDDARLTLAERFKQDLAFHEGICRLAGNMILLRMWTSAKDLMWITALDEPDEQTAALMTRDNHEPIVAALRAGNPDEARRLIEQHMRHAADVWAARAA